MRPSCFSRFIALFAFLAALAFGQGGTGTITGTITDPTGLPVAGANVEARNTATGVVYTGASTNAGNYAVPNLPVGTYGVTVKVPGFKTYTHTNLVVAATQVLREDIRLEVGAAAETVTVEAQASLLETESGDQVSNVTLEQTLDLPFMGIGTVNSGTSGYRNPYNTLQTLPGVSSYTTSGTFAINGLGGAVGFAAPLTETMRIEGQDATSRIFGNYDYTQMAQPNVDAVQEVAYQTSNYAPEFGQAGSVVINMTMKSGTNQYHGSAFEEWVNEDLNAGDPFTSNGAGGKARPRNRRNDFGGTLGGPIIIPKIYNGRDKTFFFFAYEQYLEGSQYNFTDTVPTAAMRAGDFSALSANGTCALCAANGIPTAPLGRDPAGNPIYANEIFDPSTRAVAANGQGYALPFANNVIPSSRFNASSLAFQNLFPQPQNGNLIGNYDGTISGGRYSAIPALKADQIISQKDKLSFYWSRNNTESQISSPLGNADGLPTEIGGYRGTFIPTYTIRLNYDRTLSPTLLLHLGGGYYHTSFSDRAPFLSFQPSQFGLTGFLQNRQFPSVTGMCAPAPFGAVGCGGGANGGGMQNIGTSAQIQSQNYEEKPSFNANATWVHGNHTFKLGAEVYFEQAYTGAFSGVTLATASLSGAPVATAEPFVPTFSLNGFNMGYNYASFLLGDYAGITQTPAEFTRAGSQTWGLFLQDSWKVTRRLTLNYGIRWDYDTPEHEQYGRWGQLDETLANPNAGGHPGAVQYASTCNCPFYQKAYPYALGPRLGIAYQIDSKTVFRGGWGLNYQFVANPAGATIGTNGVYPLAGVNPYVNVSTPGSIVQPTWPVTNPFIYPVPGTVGVPGTSTPLVPDANQNRPPRINQFSFGFQREITPNFILEASYVANRAVWLQGFTTGFLSETSQQQYARFGLYPYPGTGPCSSGGGVCPSTTYNNYADYLLTLQPLNSAAVINGLGARGVKVPVPYNGFPLTNSLQSALYPFPQYGALEPSNSPTGRSKYDSLQVKATKRVSHGLQAGGAFTWGQGFHSTAPQDFFNPQSTVWELQQIPQFALTFNAIYTVPKARFFPKVVNAITSDWQIGWWSDYQSGQYLAPPISTTLNLLPSEDIRVAGAPLYTPGVNLNDHGTFSPYYTQVLNPAAWQQCPANAACGSANITSGFFGPQTNATNYYKDFKGPRTPSENANIGRNFRFHRGDRVFNLYVRAEFVNIFNRTLFPNPSTANPQNPVVRGAGNGSILTSGFGVISAYFPTGSINGTAPYLLGRTGTLIARFNF
ncbi:MAG TPA: TonB-dependent receptor [Bryobacteraceae bacterium]